jgi:predicted membrane chloride channel (bestrophin family)
MKVIAAFLKLFDYHVVVVAALALVATYACTRYGITADLPTSLIAVAIVFPIVFSINAAYQRREQALRHLSRFQGFISALYFANRDWVGKEKGAALAPQFSAIGAALITALTQALNGTAQERKQAAQKAYDLFSQVSDSNEAMRSAGLAATEVSRVNNYLREMIQDFEAMRIIAEYRTPSTLRAFSKIYLNSFPLLYAPLYAQIAQDAGIGFGIGVALAFAFVLVGLDNVQDKLENPFDGIGDDDVRFEASSHMMAGAKAADAP